MGLVLMIAGVVLDVMRLRNIGLSRWFAMLRFVPFGSSFLYLGLQCAQPGWAGTRRLDGADRSILFVELLLLGLVIFMYFRLPASLPFSPW